MRLDMLDAYSETAHETNEDAWGCTEVAGWVIDGASSVNERQHLSSGSDTATMVQLANRSIQHSLSLPAADFESERSAVAAAAENIRVWIDGHHVPRDFVPPSAAVSIAGISNYILHFYGLGDVDAYYLDNSGHSTTFDNNRLRQKEQAHISQFGGRLDGTRARASIRRTRSERMNRPGGYWILGNAPEAADHGRTMSIPVKPGGYMLIASDGFTRCLDVYEMFADPVEMVTAALAVDGLSNIVERIREIERSDPACEIFPRATPHDDATAVLFKVI